MWLGWYANAQLSVVNVVTFTNALVSGFHWEFFLAAPLVFILWAAVAAALLYWGRGPFCGWLCPFGALQELLHDAAKALHVPQFNVPWTVHERLWPIKYMIFLGLFGLSLYSVALAETFAEVEPFKTAIILKFNREFMFIAIALLWLLPGLFIERFFCRYLCPINSYISLYSTAGRVMVRAVSPQPCSTCSERFCLTGSAKGWGCPYGLCVGELDRNNDCGACMECVKTCAYDNVAVFWRNEGRDTQIANYGEAWQAIVMFALACLYCVTNFGAWDKVRDWIDIVDKSNWATFGVYAAAVWTGCLVVLPLLWYAGTKAGLAVSRSTLSAGDQFRATAAALIPIGLACWIAFALGTSLSMMTFVLQSLSDPFNWGWNLLGMAGSRWHIIWSAGIPWLQAIAVVIGFAFALPTLTRCWRFEGGRAAGASGTGSRHRPPGTGGR